MAELNKEKLFKTDFMNRFLNFVERFDLACNKNTSAFVQKWIKEEEYDYIKYFLFTSPVQTMLPFSLHEFAQMPPEVLLSLQSIYTRFSALLSEKQELYDEFITYYE